MILGVRTDRHPEVESVGSGAPVGTTLGVSQALGNTPYLCRLPHRTRTG